MKDQDNMLNILKMSPSVALLRSRNYDIIIVTMFADENTKQPIGDCP